MLETLAYLSQILGGVGIFLAAVTLLVHQRQLNFEVIASCTERFQKIMVDMDSKDEVARGRAERGYVDLCNEQIFYFQNGYLPGEVMEEWLDGMVYRLPLWKAPEAEEVHPEHAGQMGKGLFEEYSRIREAFAVDEPCDLESPGERRALVRRLRRRVEPKYGVRPLVERLVDYVTGNNRDGGKKAPPRSETKSERYDPDTQTGRRRPDNGSPGGSRNPGNGG